MRQLGFTSLQELIFTEFSKEKISQRFYFTGGTALSVFYLQHRISEDLDFFSEKDFDYLPKMIKPLTLDELKSFFRERAKEIGRRITV